MQWSGISDKYVYKFLRLDTSVLKTDNQRIAFINEVIKNGEPQQLITEVYLNKDERGYVNVAFKLLPNSGLILDIANPFHALGLSPQEARVNGDLLSFKLPAVRVQMFLKTLDISETLLTAAFNLLIPAGSTSVSDAETPPPSARPNPR